MMIGRKLQLGVGAIALTLGMALAAVLSTGAGALATVHPSAVTDHNLPARTEKALAALGLNVSWPIATGARTVRPGARLTVAMSAHNAKALSVAGTVTLTEITSAGRTILASVPLGDVSGSASLTGWRLSLLIPRTAGVRYALALSAGKLRYASAVSASGTPAAAVSAPNAAHAARVTLSPAHTTPSETVAFSVENTGRDPLRITQLAWQRQGSGGSWVPYAYGASCCPSARAACPEYVVLAAEAWSVTLGPGDSASNTTAVPPASASGSFRLAPEASGPGATATPAITLSSQATQVTASNPCGTSTGASPGSTVTTSTTTTEPVHPQPQTSSRRTPAEP
jgi:hypothetical protein